MAGRDYKKIEETTHPWDEKKWTQQQSQIEKLRGDCINADKASIDDDTEAKVTARLTAPIQAFIAYVNAVKDDLSSLDSSAKSKKAAALNSIESEVIKVSTINPDVWKALERQNMTRGVTSAGSAATASNEPVATDQRQYRKS